MATFGTAKAPVRQAPYRPTNERPPLSESPFSLTITFLLTRLSICALMASGVMLAMAASSMAVLLARPPEAVLANADDLMPLYKAIEVVGMLGEWLFPASAVATTLLLAVFLYGALTNLQLANVAGKRTQPADAFTVFLMPGLNLWKPPVVMLEVWRGALHPYDADVAAPRALPLWWAGTLLAVGLAIFSKLAMGPVASGASPIQMLFVLDLVISSAVIASSVCLLMLLNPIAKAQQDFAGRHRGRD